MDDFDVSKTAYYIYLCHTAVARGNMLCYCTMHGRRQAIKNRKKKKKKKRKKSLASSSQRLWSVFALMAGYVTAMLGPVEHA